MIDKVDKSKCVHVPVDKTPIFLFTLKVNQVKEVALIRHQYFVIHVRCYKVQPSFKCFTSAKLPCNLEIQFFSLEQFSKGKGKGKGKGKYVSGIFSRN